MPYATDGVSTSLAASPSALGLDIYIGFDPNRVKVAFYTPSCAPPIDCEASRQFREFLLASGWHDYVFEVDVRQGATFGEVRLSIDGSVRIQLPLPAPLTAATIRKSVFGTSFIGKGMSSRLFCDNLVIESMAR